MSEALQFDHKHDGTAQAASGDPNDLHFYFEQEGRFPLKLPLPKLGESRMSDAGEIPCDLDMDPSLLVDAIARSMQGLKPATRRKLQLYAAGHPNALLISMGINPTAAAKKLKEVVRGSRLIDSVVYDSPANSQSPPLELLRGGADLDDVVQDAKPLAKPQTVNTKEPANLKPVTSEDVESEEVVPDSVPPLGEDSGTEVARESPVDGNVISADANDTSETVPENTEASEAGEPSEKVLPMANIIKDVDSLLKILLPDSRMPNYGAEIMSRHLTGRKADVASSTFIKACGKLMRHVQVAHDISDRQKRYGVRSPGLLTTAEFKLIESLMSAGLNSAEPTSLEQIATKHETTNPKSEVTVAQVAMEIRGILIKVYEIARQRAEAR